MEKKTAAAACLAFEYQLDPSRLTPITRAALWAHLPRLRAERELRTRRLTEKLSPDEWYDLVLAATEDKKLAMKWLDNKAAEERYASGSGSN